MEALSEIVCNCQEALKQVACAQVLGNKGESRHTLRTSLRTSGDPSPSLSMRRSTPSSCGYSMYGVITSPVLSTTYGTASTKHCLSEEAK